MEESEILNDHLSEFPRLIKYFRMFGGIKEPDAKRQQAQIDAIEKYNKKIQTRISQRKKPKNYPDPNQYYSVRHFNLTALIYFSKQVDQRLSEIEEDNLGQLLVLVNEMALALSSDSSLYIDIESFEKHLLEVVNTEEEYIKYHNYHIMFKSRIKALTANWGKSNYSSILGHEILSALQRYKKDIKYSPPSDFDLLFNEYLYSHPKFSKMIEPTAIFIADPNLDKETIKFTINRFADDIYKSLNMDMKGPSKHVVFTSLIRLLFAEAYSYGSGLNDYADKNGLFLIKCAKFSRQSVRELKLTNDVISTFTPGLPIYSLFKGKKLGSLKSMELTLNPIDLMYQVFSSLDGIQKAFGGGKALSFDDMFTLLLAYMSLNPPSNAYAISRFCEKWEMIQFSNSISISKNYFMAAVNHLLAQTD